MNVVKTIEEIRQLVADTKRAGKTVGLVPTMGALHEGHLSLIEAARDGCEFVVVSIFVNPTQFAPNEDLSAYPKTPREDLSACESLGVDAVFMPSADVMYYAEAKTAITVAELSNTLCGCDRPTHFVGVCTVVAKLFNIVQPNKAYFGAKDFQQVTIIRRMVEDLNFPVEIVRCPIVREADGVAMSSRNAYLTSDQRKQACGLIGSLQLAESMIRRSRPLAEEIIAAMRAYLAEKTPDGQVDYIQIVDPLTLRDVAETSGAVLIALAVQLGKARLIDNMLVDAEQT